MKNNGGITEDQIKVWKGKHRKVYSIEINDDGDIYTGYFKRPDMDTLAASAKMAKSDEMKAANILFDNTWLGGAIELKNDAILKLGAISRLNGITTVQSSELKNL